MVTLLEDGRLLTRRESVDEPPNYFLRDLERGMISAVTEFPHPYPQFAGIRKEAIQYERGDGIPLSAILYLPADYDQERDGPLPAFVWAYPTEFKSAAAAGQRRDSPYQFTRIPYGGAVPYVTRGYAVLDNASMPVIGEGDAEPNDTFREQLVANAQAAVDEGVRRGVVDPDRVGVGGHSYGAFMAGNLLAHSDIFRAGVARSGAYNRTLTPFGFQREQRLFWEDPDLYLYMSPFMHARQGERAHPHHPRRGRQQLGYLPHPVTALLRGAQGAGRDGAARLSAGREPRLRGARVGPARPVGDRPLARDACETAEAPSPRRTTWEAEWCEVPTPPQTAQTTPSSPTVT